MHCKAVIAQHFGDEIADQDLVFDDENAGSPRLHDRPLKVPDPRRSGSSAGPNARQANCVQYFGNLGTIMVSRSVKIHAPQQAPRLE